MVFVLPLLLPFDVAAVWLFFRRSPRPGSARGVRVFNLISIALTLILCALAVLQIRAAMAGGSDQRLWGVMAALSAMIAFPVCLAVAAGIRHLVYRKASSAKPLETPDLSNTRF